MPVPLAATAHGRVCCAWVPVLTNLTAPQQVTCLRMWEVFSLIPFFVPDFPIRLLGLLFFSMLTWWWSFVDSWKEWSSPFLGSELKMRESQIWCCMSARESCFTFARFLTVWSWLEHASNDQFFFSFLSICLCSELQEGIEVTTENGEVVGNSKVSLFHEWSFFFCGSVVHNYFSFVFVWTESTSLCTKKHR